MPHKLHTVEVPAETKEERDHREAVASFRDKLERLAEVMAGRVLWRREHPRAVAMSKRDIYRAFSGWRNKPAFEDAWKSFVLFQEIKVERGRKLEVEYLPMNVLGPAGPNGAIFFNDGKLDTASALTVVTG